MGRSDRRSALGAGLGRPRGGAGREVARGAWTSPGKCLWEQLQAESSGQEKKKKVGQESRWICSDADTLGSFPVGPTEDLERRLF